MRIQTDLLDQLILLASLGHGNSTGVKECLQATVAPRTNRLIECVVFLELCVIRCFSELITGFCRGSTKSACGRRSGVPFQQGVPVLFGKSNDFITLAPLGYLDAVLVCPVLDFAVTPSIENEIGEAFLRGFS